MKTFKLSLAFAFVAFLLTSCGAYSQSGYYGGNYDRGYYDNDEYYEYDDDNYAYNDYESDIAFQTFYSELSPHGRWMNHRNYGQIWIPRAGRNFHPYATNGYWVMTDYGNMWVSNYSWGWAPFHYGRWFFDDYYGWAWIPGYEWAPAWVSWRSGGGYYGWAPMGPGISIHININTPSNYWTFIPNRYMYHRNMHRYYNGYSHNVYNQTTIVNNTYIYNNNHYYSGPSARDYERETGRRTSVRTIENTSRRVGTSTTRVLNDRVSIYRPDATQRNSSTDRASKPSMRQSSTRTNGDNNTFSKPNESDRRTNGSGRVTNNNDVNRSNATIRNSRPSGRTQPRVNQSTHQTTRSDRNGTSVRPYETSNQRVNSTRQQSSNERVGVGTSQRSSSNGNRVSSSNQTSTRSSSTKTQSSQKSRSDDNDTSRSRTSRSRN